MLLDRTKRPRFSGARMDSDRNGGFMGSKSRTSKYLSRETECIYLQKRK